MRRCVSGTRQRLCGRWLSYGNISMSHGTHMHESQYATARVMAHICTSRGTQMHERGTRTHKAWHKHIFGKTRQHLRTESLSQAGMLSHTGMDMVDKANSHACKCDMMLM